MANPLKLAPTKPNQKLLNFAEQFLERVKSGECNGIVGMLQHPGSSSYVCINVEDRYRMAGQMQLAIIKTLYEE